MSIKANVEVIVHFVSSQKVATMSMGLFGFQATLSRNNQIKSKKQQPNLQFAKPINLIEPQTYRMTDISGLSVMNEDEKSNIAGQLQQTICTKIRANQIRDQTFRTCIHKILDQQNSTDMSNDIVKFVDEIQIFPKNELKNKQLTYCLEITSLLFYRNKLKLLDEDNSFKNEQQSKKYNKNNKREIFKESQQRFIKLSKIQQGFVCYDQIQFKDNLVSTKVIVIGYITGYYFQKMWKIPQFEQNNSIISKRNSFVTSKRQASQKRLNSLPQLLQWIGDNYKTRHRKQSLTQYLYRKYVKKQKVSLVNLQNKFIKSFVTEDQWKYLFHNTQQLPTHFQTYLKTQKDLAIKTKINSQIKQQQVKVKSDFNLLNNQNSQIQTQFPNRKGSGSSYEENHSKEMEKSFDYYISFYKPNKLSFKELAQEIQSISKEIDKFLNRQLLDLILERKTIKISAKQQIIRPTYLTKIKNNSILYEIFLKNKSNNAFNSIIVEQKTNQQIIRNYKQMLKLHQKLKAQKNFQKKASVTLQSILISEINGDVDQQQFPLSQKSTQEGQHFIFCEIQNIKKCQENMMLSSKQNKQQQKKIQELQMNFYNQLKLQQTQNFIQQNNLQVKPREEINNLLTFAPQKNQISENTDNKKIAEERMLIIFCHGFQANGNNMVSIVSGFQRIFPKAHFLVSTVNQHKTEESIESLGNQLSQQIQSYIQYYLKGKIKKKNIVLNLVGHSMGGIIARAALPYLIVNFPNQFGFFCSFSSPHLGCYNAGDKLVKMGMWMIQQFNPTISLTQLLMKDKFISESTHQMHKNYSQPQIHHIKQQVNCKSKQAKLLDLKKTFLYKLSTDGSLKIFEKVILFSSADDSYVPWHSARILHLNNKQTSSESSIQKEMIENILGKENESKFTNKIKSIIRLQIDFDLKNDKKTNKLDRIIGRGAHIKFLTQTESMKTIKYTLPQIFDIHE